MAYQAPTQSYGPPTRLGGAVGEDRIRRLMEERRAAGLEVDPMAELAVTPAQSIVAQEQARQEQPSADDIVAAESAGRPKASPKFEASKPAFPVTEAERQAPARASQNARRLVEARGPAKRPAARPMSPAEMRIADKESMPDLPVDGKPMSVRGPAPSGPAPEPISMGPAQGAGHRVRNEAKEQELMARYNAAVDDGDARMAQQALADLEAERRRMATPGQEPETEDVVASAIERLAPEQQDALLAHFKGRYKSAKHPLAAAIQDMDAVYGHLPFGQILDAMAADANRLIVNANPELSVGELQKTFVPRGANKARPVGDTTGIPTTHRRLPTQGGQSYPTVTGPNGEGYGTFEDVGGSLSLAAPQTSLIELASKQSSTPPKIGGPDGMTAADMRAWEEAMIQAAVASGLDVQKFRNRGEIVRAGQEMLRRHEQLTKADETKGFPSGRYEVQYNPTGRPIYTPTDEMRKNAEDAKGRAHANEFVRNFQPTEEVGLAVRRAAEAGDFNAVRALMQQARNERAAGTAAATREMGLMRGRTQNMNNPAVAPAMFEQSIMNAESPEDMGRVMLGWGGVSPQAGRVGAGMVAQASAQEAAAAQAALDRQNNLDIAETAAEAKKKQDAISGFNNANNTAAAAMAGDPENWVTHVNNLAFTYTQLASSGAEIPGGRDANTAALNFVARSIAQQNPQHPAVQQALKKIYERLFPAGLAGAMSTVYNMAGDNRPARFVEQAVQEAGVTPEFAQQYLDANRKTSGAPSAPMPTSRPAPAPPAK